MPKSTRTTRALMWSIPIAAWLGILIIGGVKSLAVAVFFSLIGYLLFMLGRNYEWKKSQSH
jgi:hypothetical protein